MVKLMWVNVADLQSLYHQTIQKEQSPRSAKPAGGKQH